MYICIYVCIVSVFFFSEHFSALLLFYLPIFFLYNICIYTYVYTCYIYAIYIYIYIYIHMHVCKREYICIYVYIYVYNYIACILYDNILCFCVPELIDGRRVT